MGKCCLAVILMQSQTSQCWATLDTLYRFYIKFFIHILTTQIRNTDWKHLKNVHVIFKLVLSMRIEYGHDGEAAEERDRGCLCVCAFLGEYLHVYMCICVFHTCERYWEKLSWKWYSIISLFLEEKALVKAKLWSLSVDTRSSWAELIDW